METKSSKRLKIENHVGEKGLRFFPHNKKLPEVIEKEILKMLPKPDCKFATKEGSLCNRQFWFVEQDITPSPQSESKESKTPNRLDCTRFCINFDSKAWLNQIFNNLPPFVNYQDPQDLKKKILSVPTANSECKLFLNFYWPTGEHKQVLCYKVSNGIRILVFGNNPFQATFHQDALFERLGFWTQNLQFDATVLISEKIVPKVVTMYGIVYEQRNISNLPENYKKIKSFGNISLSAFRGFGRQLPETEEEKSQVHYFGPVSKWKRPESINDIQQYFGNVAAYPDYHDILGYFHFQVDAPENAQIIPTNISHELYLLLNQNA